MIKKWSKYLLTAICVFFVSLMGANAKEVTIDGLTDLVKEFNPQANSVFVIGEYAFTSAHELTLKDIMLASRSIEVPDGSGDTNKDPIYEEMIIDAFNGTLGSDFKLQSLTYAGNLIGDAKVKETYNIRYVDYNKIYDEVDLVKIAKNAYDKYAASLSDILTSTLDETGTKLDVTVKNLNSDLGGVDKEALKETAKELSDKFFKTDGIKSVTITFETSDGKTLEKEITKEFADSLYAMTNEELKDLVKEFLNENYITIDSVIGGKAVAVVNLEDGYKATDGIDTFEATFAYELDLKGLADKAYSKYNKDYAEKLSEYVVVETLDGITYNATIKTALPDISLISEEKLNEIKDILKEKAENLLEKAKKVPGVKSVTITLVTSDGRTIEEEVTLNQVESLSQMSKDELIALVEEYATTNNITVDSLVGGTLTAKVNLKDGYTAKDGIDTFNASLTAEINFKGLVNKVYSKYDADYREKLNDYVSVNKENDTTFEVLAKVLLTDTSLIPEEKINELKEQYKDEITKVRDLLNEVTYVPGLDSLVVTITPADGEVITMTITEEQLLALKDKSLDELKTLAKEYVAANNLTVDSVIGGEVTLKIDLKDGYTATDDVDTFTAKFKAEINFKEVVNKVYNKYDADYRTKLNDYVSVNKEDLATFEVTAKVLTTDLSLIEEKLNELKEQYKDEITKVKDIINGATYIPGLESVTLTLETSDGKVLTANITEEEALALRDKTLDELKAIAKEYISANGLTIDSLVGGSLTAKANLKPGYTATDNVDTFKVVLKAEYDLKGLANTAYNKFNSEYAILLESFATVEKVTTTEYNVTVKTTDETKLTALANQLKAQAGDLLGQVSSVPGVDTITVKLNTSDDRTFTKNITTAHLQTLNEMSVEEIKTALKALAAKHSLNVNSILGGNVEAKINLKKGYSAKDGVDTFKVNILASEYNVYFDVDGALSAKTVKVGNTVAKPEDPTKEGYTFDKWLLNGNEYDFTTKVNAPITLKASWNINTYEVIIESNAYGTVSKTTLPVEHGTTVTTDGNVLKIGNEEITATPNTNTAQYKYSFDKWTGVPEKVTGAVTITANFKQEESFYKVNVAADELGNVSESLIENVAYGTAITATGNVLKIGDKEITATPIASGAQYTYSFDKWNISESTVTKDLTITASFKAEVNKYTVSFAYNDENFGKVNKTLIEVPYGSEIKIDGNKITIGEEEIIATPAENTAQYKYSFNKWTNVPTSNKITESTVIYANFNQTEVSLYTITFKSNDSSLGSVDETSLTDLQEGTEIEVDGNKITIGMVTITAKVTENQDENYNYSFDRWDMSSNTVAADMTITAIFKKEPKKYDVSISSNNTAYGLVSASSINASYDSVITTDGNKVTIDGTTVTATPTVETDTKYYTFESWTVSTDKVTSTTTITANFKEWTKVNVASNVSSAVNANYDDNRLKNLFLISPSQYKHSMDFSESNNTITLKYSGTKESQNLIVYDLNKIAVESFDIIDLMEKLTDGYSSIYESVIWDYKGWKNGTEYFDLMKLVYDDMNPTGFQTKTDSATIFARFMAYTSGLSGGSNFANIDLDTMIANTTANPIKMTIKLKDGYVTTDGKREVTYNVVFAK